MVEREGLQQKVRRAGLHGVDRVLYGAEGRHHDYGHMRILAPDQLQHLQTGHAGELEIGQDQVGPVHEGQTFLGARGLNDIEAGVE